MQIWNRNKVWFIASILLAMTCYELDSLHVQTLVRSTADIGVLFIVLTLLPGNILKLRFFTNIKVIYILAFLTKYRRDFGIIGGILILEHSLMVLSGLGMISSSGFVPNWEILTSKPLLPGVIGLVLLVVLLITSNAPVTRLLGKKWKMVQSLVWIMVPLSFAHAALVGEELPLPAYGLLGVMAFVGLEWLSNRKKPATESSHRRHLILTAVGFLLVMALWWM